MKKSMIIILAILTLGLLVTGVIVYDNFIKEESGIGLDITEQPITSTGAGGTASASSAPSKPSSP